MSLETRTVEMNISCGLLSQLVEQYLDSIGLLSERDQVTKMTFGAAATGVDLKGNPEQVFPMSVSFKKEMEVRVIPLND
jgi:hypothetical protein